MTLITNDVPNMIGGVSQQPDTMRLVNQCEAQENCVGNPVEGLTKCVVRVQLREAKVLDVRFDPRTYGPLCGR